MVQVPSAHHLHEAADAVAAAIRTMQEAQEVRWQSALAQRYRTELYGAIQEVRAIANRVDDAENAWSRLRALAVALPP